MATLTKTHINYIEGRVNSTAMCICGKLGAEEDQKMLERKLLIFHCTSEDMLINLSRAYEKTRSDSMMRHFIAVGVVKVREDYADMVTDGGFRAAFDWTPLDEANEEYDAVTKVFQGIKADKEEMVHLQAKRIIDEFVIGITPIEKLTDKLEEFVKEFN